MGLDVYFRRDIANVLRATACASDGPMELAAELLRNPGEVARDVRVTHESEQEKLMQVYRLGVRNALLSVGLAFGLEPVSSGSQGRPGVSPGLAGLLWAEIPRER